MPVSNRPIDADDWRIGSCIAIDLDRLVLPNGRGQDITRRLLGPIFVDNGANDNDDEQRQQEFDAKAGPPPPELGARRCWFCCHSQLRANLTWFSIETHTSRLIHRSTRTATQGETTPADDTREGFRPHRQVPTNAGNVSETCRGPVNQKCGRRPATPYRRGHGSTPGVFSHPSQSH